MLDVADVRRAVAQAFLAELAWVPAPGTPTATAVVPLLLGERPAVALPYAYADALRPVSAAPVVALTLTDGRMAGPAWRALRILGRPTVVDDVTGAIFTEQLLDQELRKHPPSRAYAKSPLLRRENWWYLPRLVVEIEVTSVEPVERRTDPARHALLVVAAPDGTPVVETVMVDDWDARPVLVSPLARDVQLPEGPAALLGHDVSVPDLEQWVQFVAVGQLAGGLLSVAREPEGPRKITGALGLRSRLRRHRELERACRAAIAAAERAAR